MKFHGFELTVDPHLCQVTFVRWRKNHRKARINKKWHKKYGYVSECKQDSVYQVMGRLIGCPCMIAKLRQQIPIPFPTMPPPVVANTA